MLSICEARLINPDLPELPGGSAGGNECGGNNHRYE